MSDPLPATRPPADDDDDATAVDRRQAPRLLNRSNRLSRVVLAGAAGVAAAAAGGGGDGVVTCVVDYSLHGAGVIHPAEIPPDTLFWLETESGPGRPATRRLMRSSRCTPMHGGRYLVGAEFVDGA